MKPNRHIYRVYNTKQRKYVTTEYRWCLTWHGILSVLNHDGTLFPTADHIVMECSTGLLDRNGVEIFEGDVVDSKQHGQLKIYWYHGRFAMGSTSPSRGREKRYWLGKTYAKRTCTITGSIHDSPQGVAR